MYNVHVHDILCTCVNSMVTEHVHVYVAVHMYNVHVHVHDILWTCVNSMVTEHVHVYVAVYMYMYMISCGLVLIAVDNGY